MATIPLGLLFCSGKDSLRTPSRSEELCRVAQSAALLSSASTWQSGGPKSSVDDLCAGRGVVLGRAATILRSIETQPFWLEDLSCQLDKSSEFLGSNEKAEFRLFWAGALPFFIWLVFQDSIKVVEAGWSLFGLEKSWKISQVSDPDLSGFGTSLNLEKVWVKWKLNEMQGRVSGCYELDLCLFYLPQIVKFIKVFILGVRKITPLRSSLKRRDLFKVVEVSRSLCAASKRE